MQGDEFKVKISIIHKIMLYATLLVFISVGISTYLAVKAESKVFKEGLINKAKYLAKDIGSSTRHAFSSLNWIFVEKMLKESVQAGRREVIYTKVVNPNGEVYLASDRDYYGEKIDSSLLSDQAILLDNYFFPQQKEHGILSILPINISNERWHIIMGLSIKSIKEAIRSLIIRNLTFGGLIVLLGVIGSLFLSRSISGPIINLANAAKIISSGNLDHNVTIQSRDEVGLLGYSFNQMLDSLKRAEEQLKNYSQNLEKMVDERTAELKKTLAHLQNTQSQLLQSEKMASIGQLAAGVAHEINNPVGFVKSNLGTMNEYRKDLMRLVDHYRTLEATVVKDKDMQGNGALQKALENIQKVKEEIDLSFILDDYSNVINESFEGMARVAKIVADLKDFAHVDKAELEHADLNKGIESTLNIVWNELKYKAEVIKDLGDIPPIECYPQRLNQVFMNILVNAAQSIENKGEIRITTRADNEHVEIRISDTGTGIPPDVLPKIFDPFFTTKDVGKGTGLGLNMAYNIIQKHKGTIDVESEAGKGTTFIIRLQIDPDLVE